MQKKKKLKMSTKIKIVPRLHMSSNLNATSHNFIASSSKKLLVWI
jgi:hypothetical protein